MGVFLLSGCLTKEKMSDDFISLREGLLKFKNGEITQIKSEGVIINLYNSTKSNFTKAYVESEDGNAGVVLFWQDSSVKDNLQVGDLVEFKGPIEVFNGEIEVKPEEYEVKEHNNAVQPKELTNSLLEKWQIGQDETTPNMILVTTSGTVSEFDSKNATITVENLNINELLAYLYSGFSGVSVGDKIEVTGILKLYKGEWEISLISGDDYEVLNSAPEVEVEYSGIAKVKNDIVDGSTNFTGIKGIVVYKNGSVAVVNDATTGIYIKEGMDSVNINIGDEITFDAVGYLDTYYGNIRLKQPENIQILSSNNPISTFSLNINLNDKTEWKDFIEWGYRLVKVKGSLTSNDDSTYNLTYKIGNGGNANILVYSKSLLETAYGNTIPDSTEATVTGYLAKYKGTWQIYLRDENDVEF
jgi:DNA/RNA endonuclease YhcR with UshA esterase domain